MTTSRTICALFVLMTAALAMAPDLDVWAFYLGIDYAAPLGHRGFTHSLLFALGLGGAAALFVRRRVGGHLLDLWGFFFLVTASHDGALKLWAWPTLTLRGAVAMSKSLEAMAPVSLVIGRQGALAAANGLLGRVHIVDLAKEREERTFDNTPEAPGHGMHAEMRSSLAFSHDGEWLFAPDMHDGGVRILHLASGKSHPVFRGEVPFYKAMSISVPASLVALLRPGDVQGRGPYGLEVWRLTYATR